MSAALSTESMRRPGIVPGILISLALHAALILGYRLAAPKLPPEPPPNRTMTVWLQPFKPPVAKVEPAKPATTPSTRAPGSPRSRERTAVARAEATPKQPAPAADHSTGSTSAIANASATATTATTAAAAGAITAPAASYDPLGEPAAATFDMEAARRAARRVATEKDTTRPDSLAKRLDDHPLYPEDHETRLQKGIAGAKRGDCRNTPGGLLAPLVWLLDKKDSGCKW